ncbi:MAG: death-on-curing protein [Phycisphaerales bacterium]
MEQKSKGEIIIYRQSGFKTGLEVKLQDETVWLNLNQMARLFGRDKSVISRHVRSNIYAQKELSEKSTVAFFATVNRCPLKTINRN